MAFTAEEMKILSGGRKEVSPPKTPPQEKPVFRTPAVEKSVEEKRAELEMLKIDKEIERLNKPDISENSYFKDMMAMQQSHFNQLLAMQEKHNALALEIEKLKLGDAGGSWEEDLAMQLMPILPELLKKKGNSPMEMKGGLDMEKPKIPNAAQLEEYKKKIKAGEISFAQFCQDAKQAYPEMFDKLSAEDIQREYDKLKAL